MLEGPVVVTAPLDKILPSSTTVSSIVVAARVSMMPANLLSAPIVVPPVGTQNTLSDCAPTRVTVENWAAPSVPSILNM